MPENPQDNEREQLEKELAGLQDRYRTLRQTQHGKRSRQQRKQDESAALELGERIDEILWRLAVLRG